MYGRGYDNSNAKTNVAHTTIYMHRAHGEGNQITLGRDYVDIVTAIGVYLFVSIWEMSSKLRTFSASSISRARCLRAHTQIAIDSHVMLQTRVQTAYMRTTNDGEGKHTQPLEICHAAETDL